MSEFFRLWLAAGVANAFTSTLLHPLDLIKTRLQLAPAGGATIPSILKAAFAAGGWRGLFLPGLAPSILRELAYSGPRIGFYTPVRDSLLRATSADPSSVGIRVGSAMVTVRALAPACGAARVLMAHLAAPPHPAPPHPHFHRRERLPASSSTP